MSTNAQLFIEVYHSSLKRFDDESPYKSVCPFCAKGILPMTRDQRTHKLLDTDMCLCCGQLVKYADFNGLELP